MRSGLIHLGVLAAACLLWSCGGHGHDSHGGDGEHHDEAEPQEHAHSGASDVHQAVGGLKLDEGHKWKADDHTRATLLKMASSFLGSELAEGDELKRAGSDLHGLIDELIEGCTMTGAASLPSRVGSSRR